jgi:hypothetical protein
MPGDGQSEELVEEVFCEVAAAHVRELVREGSGEVFAGEICEQRGRDKDDAVASADGRRADDLCRCGELGVVNGEDASAALPDGEGFPDESDGLRCAMERARAVKAIEETPGDEEEHDDVSDEGGGLEDGDEMRVGVGGGDVEDCRLRGDAAGAAVKE